MKISNVSATFTNRNKKCAYNQQFLKPYNKIEKLQSKAEELNTAIHQYQSQVIKFSSNSEILEVELDKLIRKSLIYSEIDFNQNTVVTYNNLSRLKRDIHLIENEILTAILLKNQV